MKTRKRFTVVSLLLPLISVCGGLLVWYLFVRGGYTSTARLLVLHEPPRVLFRTVEAQSVDDYRRYQQTQITLVKSRLVLNSAAVDERVSKFRLIREQNDPLQWLKDNLRVEFVGGSEVMEISLTGDDRDEVAGLVNAVKKAYMEEVVNVQIKRRADRHAMLKKLKQTYVDMLRERQEAYRQLWGSVPGEEPLMNPEKNRYMLHDANLRAHALRLELERAEAETLLARRKKAADAGTDPAQKEIDQLEGRLAVLTSQGKILEKKQHDLHNVIVPGLTALKEEIASMQDVSRKLTEEIEALNIELEAPPRIRTIEDAVVDRR